jgi:hypothetical protein
MVGGLVLAVPSAIALTNIQANVCTDFAGPAVTSPAEATTTTATSFVIEGTGEPAMTLDVVEGNIVVGSTTVISDGTFAVEVPLRAGDTTFVVREMNNCTIKQAAVPLIHRTVTEQPPGGQEESPSPVVVLPPVSLPVPPFTITVPKPSTKPPKPSSDFLQPTITSPVGGTILGSGHLWVAGKAKPGSLVTIYVNSQGIARATADQSGNYGALVELSEGRNTLQVRSELNGQSSLSDIVEVIYILQKKPASDDEGNLVVQVVKAAAVTVSSVAVIVGGKWAFTKLRIRWLRK